MYNLVSYPGIPHMVILTSSGPILGENVNVENNTEQGSDIYIPTPVTGYSHCSDHNPQPDSSTPVTWSTEMQRVRERRMESVFPPPFHICYIIRSINILKVAVEILSH